MYVYIYLLLNILINIMNIINKTNKLNKYFINEKIDLYKENLIKFIIEQKYKIIQIGLIEDIDYIIGILFLTETNKYCKLNKIFIHGYYLAYSFINIFNKIKKKIFNSYKFKMNDITHYIISLSKNINYLNSRIDSLNPYKNKILNEFPKFNIDMINSITELFEYNKIHKELNIIDKQLNNIDKELNNIDKELNNIDKELNNIDNYCNNNCSNCCIKILSKFFHLLLQTAKFLGSGTYNEPNLLRISEYYANIFYILFKSNHIKEYNKITYTEIYDNYLNYKNKLNYSLIELNLNSETLDEILKYIDKLIIKNLSIEIILN
jgi:archaellum component FlaC